MKKPIASTSPLFTPKITKEELQAIQMVYRGEGTAHQQNLAIEVIVNKICRTYDMPYFPERPHDTSFLSGRIHCGQRIVNALKTNIGLLKDE